MTISELAAVANGYLRRDRERDIVLPVDGAPEWFTDLCRNAHNGKMPNDWSYEFISDALNALEEDDSEETEPDVDSLYPYTHDRLNWLASDLTRTSYCDDAMSDYGGDFSTTANLIALGMYYELREVFGLVRQSLAERVEETTLTGVVIQHIDGAHWLYCETEGGGSTGKLEGTAELLASNPDSPIGILLDRLTEHPEEANGLEPEMVADAVAFLRLEHPTGV